MVSRFVERKFSLEQINRNNVAITTEMKIQKPYTYPYKKRRYEE